MSTPPERDRRLARLRLERQRARQAEARRRRRRRQQVLGSLLAVVLVAGVAFLVTRGGSGKGTASPTATPSTEPCVYRSSGTTNGVVKTRPTPPTGSQPRRNGTATLVLSSGTVTFDLLAADAPCAVTSIAFLAAHKYYDGTSCDRLTTGGLQFLQCGGKPVKGTGPGYEFPDENLSPTTTYPAGTVGLVNHAANSNGAEFFLCYGESDLPPQFVPFGRITSGLDVLKQIATGGAQPAGDGAPLRATTIRSLRTSGV
ncbi:MAG: putative peptidyl-prolyl cis-trans isomerase cyclophilin type [Frankiales bacterium]|nr:putative peptidyl-prolyl cis-trans isomerase cyclophilin type [Frankiales bacterium]